MAPVRLFDATCVDILIAANPSTTDFSTCTPHEEKQEKWLMILIWILVTLKFIILLMRVAETAQRSLLREFRNLPSYELHQKLEEKYHATVEYSEGRYKTITFEDNIEKNIRTVTIVEDLAKGPKEKEPLSEKEQLNEGSGRRWWQWKRSGDESGAIKLG